MMDDEQLDMPEDWLTAGAAAGGLGAQMARFEAHLRCPICARFLETAMAAECGYVAGGLGEGRGRDLTNALVYECLQSSTTGPYDDLARHLKSIALAVGLWFLRFSCMCLEEVHAFCSMCVRDWLGRGEDFQNCPQCKANRGPNTVLHKDRLKPCMSLDSAARGFKEARAALLQAVLHQGSGSSSSGGSRSGKGSRKKGGASSSGGGGSGSGGSSSSSSSRRALGPQQQQELDQYWAAKGWSTTLKRHPGYHTVKEKVLRQEVGAMSMVSNGKKDELVFRHQTFIKLAEAEADKVKLGQPTRSRGEVVREVEEKARARLNNGGGGLGGGRQPMNLDSVAQHKGFDDMIRQMKRRQKEQKRKDKEMASGGGGGWEGGGGSRPKGEDGRAPGEGQEVERRDDDFEQKGREEREEREVREVKEDVTDRVEAGAAVAAGGGWRRDEDSDEEEWRDSIDEAGREDGDERRVASLPLPSQGATGAVARMAMEEEEEEEEEDDVVILDTVTTTSTFSSSNNNNHLKRRASGSSGNGKQAGHYKRPHSLPTSASVQCSLLPSTSLSTSWNCQSCTLTNAGPVRNCAACGVPRRVSTASKESLKAVEDTQKKLFEEAREQQQQQQPPRVLVVLEGEAGESTSQSGTGGSSSSSSSSSGSSSSNSSSSSGGDVTVRLRRVEGAVGLSYQMLGKCSQVEEEEEHDVEPEADERTSGGKASAVAAPEETWNADEDETRQLYSPSYGLPTPKERVG